MEQSEAKALVKRGRDMIEIPEIPEDVMKRINGLSRHEMTPEDRAIIEKYEAEVMH